MTSPKDDYDPLVSVPPSDCSKEKSPCTCFHQSATDKLAKRVQFADECEYEKKQYQDFVTESQKAAWYSDPTFIVGGVVVGVSLGAVLGYLLGARK